MLSAGISRKTLFTGSEVLRSQQARCPLSMPLWSFARLEESRRPNAGKRAPCCVALAEPVSAQQRPLLRCACSVRAFLVQAAVPRADSAVRLRFPGQPGPSRCRELRAPDELVLEDQLRSMLRRQHRRASPEVARNHFSRLVPGRAQLDFSKGILCVCSC